MIETILKFLLGASLGLVFILAGIFGWREPSIRRIIRKTRHGELINKIAMITVGIDIIIGSFVLAFF